jgi:hypothetical protein
MNTGDLVGIDELMFAITTKVSDREYKNGIEEGWFLSTLKDAVGELYMDSFYEVITQEFEIDPKKMAIILPKNCFNVKAVRPFSGDCCNPSGSVIAHFKRNFNNQGRNRKSPTNRMDDQAASANDQFQPRSSNIPNNITTGVGTTLYYYNIENELLMLSASASGFGSVQLTYNGLGGEFGTEPCIPRLFKQAIINWSEVEYWAIRKIAEPSMRVHYNDALSILNKRGGNWDNAILRASRMNSASRDDYGDYLGKMRT